ncbi:hypothetical protein GY45DRAFT_697167 [Cubamyces sp. BRFM 1775]|nr:hypothetical protein GY45DRAFT_697167 [Cubamyces sp. BRFM 1775]
MENDDNVVPTSDHEELEELAATDLEYWTSATRDIARRRNDIVVAAENTTPRRHAARVAAKEVDHRPLRTPPSADRPRKRRKTNMHQLNLRPLYRLRTCHDLSPRLGSLPRLHPPPKCDHARTHPSPSPHTSMNLGTDLRTVFLPHRQHGRLDYILTTRAHPARRTKPPLHPLPMPTIWGHRKAVHPVTLRVHLPRRLGQNLLHLRPTRFPSLRLRDRNRYHQELLNPG